MRTYITIINKTGSTLTHFFFLQNQKSVCSYLPLESSILLPTVGRPDCVNSIFPLNTYAFEKTDQTKTSKGEEMVQIEKREIYVRY